MSHYEHPNDPRTPVHPNSAGPPMPVFEPAKETDDQPLHLNALGMLLAAAAIAAWCCLVPVVVLAWRLV